jgi:Tfp pilus assembly protein PilF
MKRTIAVALTVMIGSAACTKTPDATPAPVQQASAASVARPAPPAVTPPPASPPAADPFAADWERAYALIDSWDGDGRKLDEARGMLVAIIEKDRRYAPAYVGLARVEFMRGYQSGRQFDRSSTGRARKFLQHALKLDPDLFEAHVTSARVYLADGDLDLARQSWDRADELRPNSPRVRLGRAALAEAEENPSEMVRLAREVLSMPHEPATAAGAWQILVTAYTWEGHLDQADVAHRQILKLEPGSAWAHGNYASFLLDRGDVDGAMREAEAAVRIVPYPIAMNTLSRALLAKASQQWGAGEFAAAGATVERIANLGESDASVEAGLGAFYETASIRSKQPDMRARALDWYRKAAAHEPENQEYRKAVERMSAKVGG